MNELALVVFDMAGTTVLDRGEVPAAFTAALATQRIDVTPEALTAVRGASKRQAIRSLIPEGPQREAQTDATYAAFKAEVARRFCHDAQPVPGAGDTFAWLRSRGVKVALNTGFDRDITTLLVDALKWNDKVDAVICGDDVSQGRPAPQLIFRCMEVTGTPSVRRVAVVGDTALDLQAGDNAGVRWNIGVLTGAHRREKLESEPHTHLLSSVADLPLLFSKSAAATYVTNEAELPIESFDWGTLKWLCNAKLSAGSAQTLGICHIKAGARNPMHYHPNCEELLYVIHGVGRHKLDGETVAIEAGSTIRIPAGVKHNLHNTGTEPMVCLISFSSGQRETVFLD